jgi:prepilin-type N-terminal cleavage/methylation domain-containing protein
MRANRGGFTLIEVLVALVVGAIVLAGARALLDGLADHAAATVRASRAADGGANAELTVRSVVGNLALAPDTLPSFAGSAREATFASWCPSARGGLEPCDAHLVVRDRAGMQDVVLTLSSGWEVVLLRDARDTRLRYLAEASSGGLWQSQWSAGMTTPVAIGVVADGDTLLLRIGERR